ncbi:MAG: hypothetical protein PVTTEEND_002092 [Candidatus Fervidibacter sp.]
MEQIERLMEEGINLADLGRLEEAIGCYEEAINLCRQWAEGKGREEFLARALSNKGAALRRLGRLEESLNCLNEAVALYQQLTKLEG